LVAIGSPSESAAQGRESSVVYGMPQAGQWANIAEQNFDIEPDFLSRFIPKCLTSKSSTEQLISLFSSISQLKIIFYTKPAFDLFGQFANHKGGVGKTIQRDLWADLAQAANKLYWKLRIH